MSRTGDSAFATTTMGGRDPFMPKPPKVRGRAITLAVAAHVLLILAIAFGVNWRSSEPASVAAELWSATPQQAAPRAAEPPPPPAPEPKKVEPAPAPKPEPAPPPKPALPDPQIALEKARREEAKRVAAEQEQQQKEKAKRDKAERDKADREQRQKDEQLAQKKAAADKAAKEKADKAEDARLAALRDQQIKRMQGMVGATGGPTDSGTALRSSGPSSSYAGRIIARVKPNIVLTDQVDGSPTATVEVKLAPDGTIVGKRLLKSSGAKPWDDAVLRAIERTEVLPRDIDGRVPPVMQIDFTR